MVGKDDMKETTRTQQTNNLGEMLLLLWIFVSDLRGNNSGRNAENYRYLDTNDKKIAIKTKMGDMHFACIQRNKIYYSRYVTFNQNHEVDYLFSS